jgi:hypothetical protein
MVLVLVGNGSHSRFGVVHRVWICLWILCERVFVRRTAERRYNAVMGGVRPTVPTPLWITRLACQ